jgi:AcrR family transcriptional regulator
MSREARRDGFVEAAAELVENGGVAALSFDALATAAGVAKTLPYAYFGSVDELLQTLFVQVIGAIDDRIEVILGGDQAFAVVVERALTVWFDAVRDHGALVAALLDGGAHPGLATAIRRRDRASHKRWHDLVGERFGLGDPDAHLLAAMLTTSATAAVQLWATRRGTRGALIERFVTMAEGAAAALQRP